MDLSIDGNISQSYAETDATSWLWPRQDFSFSDWIYPINFKLPSSFTVNVGTNITELLVLTPFSNWANARVVIRAWDYDTSNKTNWNPISWIAINQEKGTAFVNTSMITSIGLIKVGFQAQSYTLLYRTTIDDVKTDLFQSDFNFVNSNSEFVSSNIEPFIVVEQTKNFSIIFNDAEDDTTQIKTNNTSGLLVFVSSTKQKGKYT